VRGDLRTTGLLRGEGGGSNPRLGGPADQQQPDHTETTQDETLDTAGECCEEAERPLEHGGEAYQIANQRADSREGDHDNSDLFDAEELSAESCYSDGIRVEADASSSGFSLDAMEGQSSCGSSVTWYEGSHIDEITVDEENTSGAELEGGESDNDEYASEVTWYDEDSSRTIEEVTVADYPLLGQQDPTTMTVDNETMEQRCETVQGKLASALLVSSSSSVIFDSVRIKQDTPVNL
jgi:hypothetical protein